MVSVLASPSKGSMIGYVLGIIAAKVSYIPAQFFGPDLQRSRAQHEALAGIALLGEGKMMAVRNPRDLG